MQIRKLEVCISHPKSREAVHDHASIIIYAAFMRLSCGFHAPNMRRLMHRICIIVGISRIWKSGPSYPVIIPSMYCFRCCPHVSRTRPGVSGEVAPSAVRFVENPKTWFMNQKYSDSMLHRQSDYHDSGKSE